MNKWSGRPSGEARHRENRVTMERLRIVEGAAR